MPGAAIKAHFMFTQVWKVPLEVLRAFFGRNKTVVQLEGAGSPILEFAGGGVTILQLEGAGSPVVEFVGSGEVTQQFTGKGSTDK